MYTPEKPLFTLASPAVLRDTRNRWFISDTHFFHEKFLTFEKEGGHKVRSEFSSVEEMNEIMAQRWNERVKPGDVVKHLGDVALGLKGHEYETKLDPFLSRLNGKKDLIIGNHDKLKNRVLHKHFHNIDYWKNYNHEGQEFPYTLTHVPHRLDQLRADSIINIHGHIHQQLMDEPNYICVCVEQTNYAPVHMDEIAQIVRQRGLT